MCGCCIELYSLHRLLMVSLITFPKARSRFLEGCEGEGLRVGPKRVAGHHDLVLINCNVSNHQVPKSVLYIV